ncbi:tetraacyldisaccharide 4'-kinase [Paracoccaceae bacterium]|nr:tetraacyldisaccharide 4'-kinase [Paracoccaceae bacterium]
MRALIFFPVFYFLSLVWLLLHNLRISFGRYEKMPLPVVCIGNITLGGAGKTPTVIFLARYLKKNNINAHVVSRGYGGKFKDTVYVNIRRHSAIDVGDEPLLISRHSKVWVSRKKRDGIFSAYKAGADLVLLDDGHQNFSIEKNLSIVVFDAERNLTNEQIFPLGNLRESPKSAITRADFLICIGGSVSRKKFKETLLLDHSSKIIEGEFRPSIVPKIKNRKLVAFCGIGRPEKFFSMLKELNMQVIHEVSFPDHHFYTERQLAKIFKIADKNNAIVVTTEKDHVKLSKSFKERIHPIKIELHLSKSEKLLLRLKSLVF